MKKVLLFVLLKVLEITGAVAVYLGFSWCFWKIDSLFNLDIWLDELPFYHIGYFGFGIWSLIVIAMCIFILWGLFFKALPAWINLNKKWINKILK